MEVLTATVSLILIGGLIVSPFLILYGLNRRNIKYEFIAYLIFGIITTASITLTFAWWTQTSNQILLSPHYGYDFEAMNDAERFVKVVSENIERVKSLEMSMMGIGWPLKAFMTYVFFSPYLLLVYLIVYLVKRNKKTKVT